jgi:small-conductance mechanosensitive channel
MTGYCGPYYEKTGRYLGIKDGHFFYGAGPNWVYCYCKDCWIQQIISILPQISPSHYQELQQQKTQLSTEITTLQQQKTQLTTEITTLQQQKTQLTIETTALRQQKTQLTNITTDLQQQKTLLTNDVANLKTSIKEIETQANEAIVATRVNELQTIVSSLSNNEVQVLKASGYDCSSFSLQLSNQLKSTFINFKTSTCVTLMKYPHFNLVLLLFFYFGFVTLSILNFYISFNIKFNLYISTISTFFNSYH